VCVCVCVYVLVCFGFGSGAGSGGWVGGWVWFVVEKTNNGWASCCGIFGLEGL
jgi:hypothetical protein